MFIQGQHLFKGGSYNLLPNNDGINHWNSIQNISATLFSILESSGRIETYASSLIISTSFELK